MQLKSQGCKVSSGAGASGLQQQGMPWQSINQPRMMSTSNPQVEKDGVGEQFGVRNKKISPEVSECPCIL